MEQDLGKTLPDISVILPVYNGDKHLRIAIQSILNQTYPNFEFIIINDGSTDKSSEILNYYSKKDARIRLIERENKGLVFSLNEALSMAKGKYIARMDSDDVSSSIRFEQQIHLLNITNADICGCHFRIITDIDKIYSTFIAPQTSEAVTATLILVPPFAHGSVMIRSEFLKRHSIMYQNVAAEDHYMWCDFWMNQAKFITATNFLFDYRVHLDSISNTKKNKLKNDVRSNARKILKSNKLRVKYDLLKLKDQQLSEFEEQMLLLAAYKYSIMYWDILFIKCIRRVNYKTLVLVFFKIITRTI